MQTITPEFRTVMSRNGVTNAQEQESLWSIGVACASKYGVVTGTAWGIVAAAGSGTVTLGTFTVPGYVAGFIAGAASGTIGCMMAEGPVRREMARIAAQARMAGFGSK